jgi:hypothetical protein
MQAIRAIFEAPVKSEAKAIYRIDLPKSYKLMEWAFERYNAQQPVQSKRIKMPHIFLAKELIRLYSLHFTRWQVATGYQDGLESIKDMPLLAVNNEFLGGILGRTGRSIRNYRKVLQRAGFFSPVNQDEDGSSRYEVFHGRTCDFEVLIAPEYLHILHVASTARYRLSDGLVVAMRKSFPPTSTSTSSSGIKQEQLELVGGKVFIEAEKSASDIPGLPEQQEPDVALEPEQQEPMHRNEASRCPKAPQARTHSPAGRAGLMSDEEIERAISLRQQSKILLNAAKTYLYPEEIWSKSYRLEVLDQIDRLYGDSHPDIFSRITAVYRERLKLCQLHWHKKYGPLPEPHWFFSPDNLNGFRLTKGWIDNPAEYPPPPRQTYRIPTRRRANGRGGEAKALNEIL